MNPQRKTHACSLPPKSNNGMPIKQPTQRTSPASSHSASSALALDMNPDSLPPTRLFNLSPIACPSGAFPSPAERWAARW
ncbi:hypothetical protein KC358_g43 [Hortaea werneckii]|nr:hypothetical protein KC358_g43 [Hortaea werneckii]